ncbi:MAG: glycosyltransferase [Oligoflexia bacterium]|nr:glycosyltransferase [Oligoflexia bacterium]
MQISRSGQKITFDVNHEAIEELLKIKKEKGDDFPKFGVLVLTYNASQFLEKTLDRIPKEAAELISEIFVFDDNSPDKTYEVAKEIKKGNFWEDKLSIFKNSKNLRYGGNQKVGYRYGVDRGMDYIIMLHGDGQYAPEYIPDLMYPAVKEKKEVVFASRMMRKKQALKGGMPLYKFVGNQVLTKFENFILGTKLYEFHSGYRMYSAKVLKSLPLEANTDEFHFDTQIIIQCRHLGIQIKEVPINTFYGDEECNVDGFRYAWDVVKSVIRYRLFQLHITQEASYILDQDAIYSRKKSPYSSHAKILKMIKKDSSVLCVDDYNDLLKSAIESKDCSYQGMDKADIKFDKSNKKDFLVLPDVLNKVADPKKVLFDLKDSLKTDGTLIISVPNIVMWVYRFHFFMGRFNYDQKGAMDKYNLRFYTKFSIVNLLKACGYEIKSIEPTSLPFEVVFASSGKSKFLRLVDSVYYRFAKFYHKLFSYEFVVSAKPVTFSKES